MKIIGKSLDIGSIHILLLLILFCSSSTTTSSSTGNVNPNVERRQPRYTDPLTHDPRFPDVGSSDLHPIGDGSGGLRMPG